MRKTLVTGTALFIVMLAGCQITESPETGEKTISMTPKALLAADTAAELAEPVGQIASTVSLWWPPAALLAGLFGGAAGTWKKLRPQLDTAIDTATLATAAGEATAVALEEFKTTFPDAWAALSERLKKHHGPEVENFYRALRDLPPKG